MNDRYYSDARDSPQKRVWPLRVEPCRLSAEERPAGVCAQPDVQGGRRELPNRVENVFRQSRSWRQGNAKSGPCGVCHSAHDLTRTHLSEMRCDRCFSSWLVTPDALGSH